MNNDTKINDIVNSVFEIKLAQVKQEANQNRMNEILDKLTTSVEYHIKRSDTLEELVELYKEDNEKMLTKQLEPIISHISFIKGMGYTLVIIAGLIAGLHQMGILQKLLL